MGSPPDLPSLWCPGVCRDRSSDLGFASRFHVSSRVLRAGCRGDRARVIAITSLRRRGDEIRVTAVRSQRVSSIETSFPRRGEHFRSRAFQTLVSHGDELSTVARNHDGIIASFSLRRRGDEIRVTAARSQRVPSIDFLSAAGRALPEPRLPDTDFARRC